MQKKTVLEKVLSGKSVRQAVLETDDLDLVVTGNDAVNKLESLEKGMPVKVKTGGDFEQTIYLGKGEVQSRTAYEFFNDEGLAGRFALSANYIKNNPDVVQFIFDEYDPMEVGRLSGKIKKYDESVDSAKTNYKIEKTKIGYIIQCNDVNPRVGKPRTVYLSGLRNGKAEYTLDWIHARTFKTESAAAKMLDKIKQEDLVEGFTVAQSEKLVDGKSAKELIDMYNSLDYSKDELKAIEWELMSKGYKYADGKWKKVKSGGDVWSFGGHPG